MHVLKIATAAALGMAALAGCTSQSTPPPPTVANVGTTEGTVTFTGGAVAVGIGFQWGSGTLTFQGQQYPFRVSGLSVVDVGITRITGSGTVRNLRRLADFNGNYVSISAGATLAGGGSVTSLRNQNDCHRWHHDGSGSAADACSRRCQHHAFGSIRDWSRAHRVAVAMQPIASLDASPRSEWGTLCHCGGRL